MMLMPPSASWPPVLFWAGLGLSLAAGCVYLISVGRAHGVLNLNPRWKVLRRNG